jgi:ABC-type uncharacterized transport system substrate-binding protein
MRKVIENIAKVFEKYDCYSLYDLEEQSESFGNSEYDNYYYEDLTFTKHSLEGGFCCFMSLYLKPVDLDKATFKLEINEERTFFTLSFRKEEVLLLAGEEMNKCKNMIKDINKELGKIELNEDE